MARTLAEQETLFRFDREEKVLWANTTHPGTAEKWAAKGHAVVVIGTAAGTPSSWALRLPFTKRGDWIRLFSLSVPGFQSETGHEGPNGSPEEASGAPNDE